MGSLGIIFGPPGTGKTTACLDLIGGWMDHVPVQRIAYVTFTKAAATDALVRFGVDPDDRDDLWMRTLHSTAYKVQGMKSENVVTPAWLRKFGEKLGVDFRGNEDSSDEEVADSLLAFRSGMNDRRPKEGALYRSAYDLSRLLCRTVSELDQVQRLPHPRIEECMDVGFLNTGLYASFVESYESEKARDGKRDFVDMLEGIIRRCPELPEWEYAVIDEVQDCSPLLHAVQERLFFDRCRATIMAGDDDQCQPAGTMVSMVGGDTRPIESVNVGEAVISFDRAKQALSGRRHGGQRVTGQASRTYDGWLYEIRAAGRQTRTTDGHRFVVRWSRQARFGKACVTYIMEKDGRYRVGWCQLFNAEGAWHLAVRARLEKADRIWIVGVHETRAEAGIHESILAARYGLPTITFRPMGAVYSARNISRIFRGVGDRSEAAARCLDDHGRSMRYPIWESRREKHGRKSTIMEVAACNMLPGLMEVPVAGPTKSGFSWRQVDIRRDRVQRLLVYSLRVAGPETYIADGIATHNSLYTFNGAHAEDFLAYRSRAQMVSLGQTHRFGQALADYADAIIRRVSFRQEKSVRGVDGKEVSIKHVYTANPDEVGIYGGSELVLHRHIRGCNEFALRMIAAGRPIWNERGINPLARASDIAAFEAWRTVCEGRPLASWDLIDLLTHLPSMREIHGQKTRLVVHGAKAAAKRLAPKDVVGPHDMARFLSPVMLKMSKEKNPSLLSIPFYDYYDALVRGGHDIRKRPSTVATTIHNAKGREADVVWVHAEVYPRVMDGRMDDEHRVHYVAATRARSVLRIVHEPIVGNWTAKYNYPAI